MAYRRIKPTYAHWTTDSNGTPYCTGCGRTAASHPALNCRVECGHYDVARPTDARPYFHCNNCGQNLSQSNAG